MTHARAAERRGTPSLGRTGRVILGALALAVALLVTVVGAYAGFGVLGSVVVTGGPLPGDGPAVRRIYAYVSPVHVDVIVPVADDVADWRPLILGDAFPGAAEARRQLAATTSYVAFGRGAAAFYFNVRTFDNIRPLYLADSVWDEGIVHATAVVAPEAIPGMIALDVSDAGYRRLVAALGDSLGGGAMPVPGQSYGSRDGFFRSPDDYTLIRTCNQWAGEMLREAGVPMPVWSPLPWGVARAAQRAAA